MKCFHHTDLDGLCSAAIVHFSNKYDQKHICYHPIDYKDDFPFNEIKKDEDVIIVDFSLQKHGDFEKLLKITKNVIWIDHHKSAIDKHKDIARQIKGLRSEKIPGCILAWHYFCSGKSIPAIVEMIGSYDVWDFTKYDKKDLCKIQTGIRLHEHSPRSYIWDYLFTDGATEIITNENHSRIMEILQDGEIALKYRQNTYESLIKSFSFEADFEGYRCICCNQGMTSSQLFDSVNGEYDLMIPFVFDGFLFSVSLYTENGSIDVSEIAKKYGGGGHRNAAGFQCKQLPFLVRG